MSFNFMKAGIGDLPQTVHSFCTRSTCTCAWIWTLPPPFLSFFLEFLLRWILL